ncbi:UvrD-helicase domain-containing protein [Solimonas sp. SE-A11]|uniref:UvrD-helicase domain-containing protein n=1 Tax=Solimonas sp. SE-A11 TaxID=3054954 RepID=UPI00259CE372|nr:UvrD-helicase domain-containing protein [Solimonas sp. SE-A11]
MRTRLENPIVRGILGEEAGSLERSLALWATNWASYWGALNDRHTQSELVACKDLFDRVESRPLTEEQARAVICFDNRVQVVASAGSGKTSTMVAKAAYAIHRGFVRPEQVVLLAFNKEAANELQDRAAQALRRLGVEGISVKASTFHALGLRIIGKATGETPDVPDWAMETAIGVRKLSEIIDQLKDGSPQFRTQWDLFRFVFGKSLPALGSEGPADAWDADGNGRVLTANGERVRSQEEAEIANWLFYNGVDYVYEPPYELKTANADHRQYKPDFHYPGIKLYHEHFALDARGQAPAHFEGYLEGVRWKRQLHASHGTSLFETTSHGIRSGQDYQRLEKELTARGVVLDPNPDRPIPSEGQKPMEAVELVGLVRAFISHTKSNSLTVEDMRQRLELMPDDGSKHRHRMFLGIVAPVISAWDKALAAEGGIDFEDMLNQAAGHLEGGRYDAPFHLVMADEFQDASRARARLCRAMVQKPGRFFFAVGDDWQSINRFAGADVSVMTGFREWFGHGQVLKLEQTFRCPQELCDVSSAFVSKNPAQIAKRVRSVTPSAGPVLQAFEVEHRERLASAIDQFIGQLCDGVRDGTVPAGRNGKVSVFILGRYNTDVAYLPTRRAQFEHWIDLSFLSMHRSKGREADYVILPEMVSRFRGRSFPYARADDPVLDLAMPAGDTFPLGEERRLFYVALTRARRRVILFTVKGQRSVFLRELEDEKAVQVLSVGGGVIQETRCPACKHGVIIPRTGRYGAFESCSNFPFCRYKPRKGRANVPRGSGGKPAVGP